MCEGEEYPEMNSVFIVFHKHLEKESSTCVFIKAK